MAKINFQLFAKTYEEQCIYIYIYDIFEQIIYFPVTLFMEPVLHTKQYTHTHTQACSPNK